MPASSDHIGGTKSGEPMALADLKARIRQDLIEEGYYTDSQIDEIVDYIIAHTSIDADGSFIFEAEPE